MAKDLVQDVFEKSWLKREEIEASKIKAYLLKSIYHKFIDHTRKEKTTSLNNISEIPTYSSTNFDLQEILHSAINTLNPDQKAAVLLRDYEGYSYDEIGETLNLSAAQVKINIYRARKKLQAQLGKIEHIL